MIRRNRRRKTSLVTAVVLGLTVAVGASGTAQAEPFNCRAEKFATSGRAICTTGTGTYRAVVACQTSSGSFYSYGPTVGIGTWSSAGCYGWAAAWASWQVRS